MPWRGELVVRPRTPKELARGWASGEVDRVTYPGTSMWPMPPEVGRRVKQLLDECAEREAATGVPHVVAWPLTMQIVYLSGPSPAQ